MSNTDHLMARIATRNRAKLQARLEKQRLACRCGGTKTHEKMIVCLECFQQAPLAMQRDAYSRQPEVARTAARQLIARALSKQAERQPGTPNDKLGTAEAAQQRGPTFPGGEPTTACNPPQRLKASPAPAGASSAKAARQRGPATR